ncbi:hypothetical protein A2276_07135 [candidate division WOR-1 bacterium RIFOXYA12_FULL_43_27]|uniref:Response regulatory domain-containing protein n=1 Tax=candidate division WOR-1 bacterium RIFOXYC2_FULL_46_14 TaxID=1802587 RepID=A0A1F4U394_UNCSA|nr:MAG: hypothetical protein A2276_07135 [candidate division WOR-1 bacterium RIFOXYA12_FULL_43_27]OGC18859.1 MAG: hypothetical protein A2292_07990 [candidate division WOR-1 bacterium RIFOXYB2_FULL_46_45]OGC29000.1 MAG: hypothetical protein A2232_03055 [candidate division WOR-1 bacterium RIFOXYA2_FULL_46_56]OGC39382.1 MAG: hypothetical protein A2438_06670 [candidate division WOR-1 bacterium RIFOXYC2_FULL_46_14]
MKEKPLILIVDDEKDFADNLSEIIRSSGKYDTLVAYSAEDAFKIFEDNKKLLGFANRIKLTLLDIKMPGISGLELLKKLRDKYNHQSGVMMLTAWEDAEKFQNARKGEVAAYILKPYKEEDLMNKIDRFFEGKDLWMIEKTKWDTIVRENQLKTAEEKKETPPPASYF